MPFNLDAKSVLIGVVIGYLVVPAVLNAVAGKSGKRVAG